MSYLFWRARLATRSKRHVSRVLAFAFLLSLISVPIFSESARAATAGSGDCIQTVSTTTGVTVSASGGYCYIAFKNTGAVNTQASVTWTVPSGVTSISALIVGGGGGGASRHGGGGGGGEFIEVSSAAVTVGNSITVTVGAGGSGGASNSGNWGTDGKSSSISGTNVTTSYTARGGLLGSGGTGGAYVGGTYVGGSIGTAWTCSGSTSGWCGGGGAGASASGENADNGGNNRAGNGGAGRTTTLFDATVASALVSVPTNFSGGGGGGADYGGTAGTASFGGGAGSVGTASGGFNGSDGTPNSGGGGGGSGYNNSGGQGTGGSGGSGVVVIRYVSKILELNAKVGSPSNSSWIDAITNANMATTTGANFPVWNATNKYFTFTSDDQIYKNVQYTNPATYSIEIWFRTTQVGTKIIGFQNAAGIGTTATAYDRHLYVDSSGKLVFGIYNNSQLNSLTSAASVNDGVWHHAVATFTGTTQELYLDNVKKSATVSNLTQSYSGYWVIGGGNLNSWITPNTNGAGWEGDIALANIYPTVLSSSEVSSQFSAAKTSQTLSISYAAGTGGSGSAPISPTSVIFGSTFTTPTNTYNKTGYSFAGWSDGTATYAANATYPASGTASKDLTLTATWNTDTYTITYNTNGGNTISNATFTGGGSAITLPTPTKTGYTFSGWFESIGLTGSALTSPYTPTQTRTIYAKWTANTYSISYNTDGGSTLSNGSFTVGGSAVTLPSPTKSGLLFQGWYSDSGKTTFIGRGGSSYSPSADVTLYAGWTNLLVNLDASDSTSLPNDASWTGVLPGSSSASGTATGNVSKGTTGSLSYATFDGTGDSYTFSAGTGQVSGEMTFEAWINPATMTTGTTWQIIGTRWFSGPSTANAIDQDWHFALYKDGNTAKLRLDTTGSTGTGAIYGSRTFPVTSENKWYLVSFSINSSNQVQLYVNGKPDGDLRSVLRTPSSTAQLWVGDARTSSAGMQGSISKFRIYNKGLTASEIKTNFISEGPTFGHQTITFNANDGSANPTTSTQVVETSFATALDLNTFTRTGYTFAGWTTNANGSGTSYTNGQNVTITSGLTLYAKWTEDTYTVSYNSNGGTSVSAGTFPRGGSVASAPTAPTRTGYTFAGWTATDGGSLITFPYSPGVNSNITLYAKWTIPESARLIGLTTNGSIRSETTYTIGTSGNVRGLTSDGTYLYFRPSNNASVIRQVDLNGSNVVDHTVTGLSAISLDQRTLAYSKGCIYIRKVLTGSDTTLTCIDTSTWQMVDINTPSSKRPPLGGGWLLGNLIDFPDGRIGSVSASNFYNSTANQTECPVISVGVVTYCKVLRLYSISGRGVNSTLSFSEDIVLADMESSWPSDDHGIATDGTYLYQIRHLNGYKVWALKSGAASEVIFNGDGTGTCQADAGTSGTKCPINPGTLTNPTFITHLHAQDSYVVGDYDGTKFYVTKSVAPPQGPGSATSYAVTYDSKGGTSVADGTFPAGGSIASAPTSPTRTGYTFAGWTATDGGTAVSFPYTPGIASDIILYAKWTANSNTVTFNSNYGTPTTTTQSITTDVSTALTANSFTRTGYTFSGWNTAANGSGSDYSNSQSVSIDSDLTLYAKWTANSNTVTFNSNYGTPTTSTQSITSGSATALTSNSFTRNGYTFAGWNTLAGGGGTSYTDGQSITIYAPFTLYAQWTEIRYTVTYDKNGASGAPEKSSEVYGIDSTGALSLSTTGTMTKSGYTFDGWYTAASGGSKIGNASASYTPSADITLYARWNAASYTVTFNSTGSTSGSAPSNLTYTTGGSAVTIPNAGTLSKSGYTFSKWNTRADGLGTDYAIGASLTTSAPVALYPIWSAISYSITYSTQNSTSGSAPTDSTVYNIGDTAYIKANTSLVRTGYTFAGWTIAQDNSGTVNQSGDTYTFGAGSITLYPKWTPNTYNISYNSNGATTDTRVTKSETYTSGDPGISLPNNSNADMVKPGYTFAGWATTPTGTVLSGSSATSYITSADVTLYAIWNKKSTTYKYNRGAINAVDMTGSEVATFPGDGTTTVYFNDSVTFSSNISSTINYGGNSYKFFGWTDGNTTYQPGNTFPIDTGVIDSNPPITFRAQWIQIFLVKYALNGGTGVVDVDDQCDAISHVCTDGQSIQLNDAPTKAGYTFAGWDDLSGTNRAAGSTMSVNSSNYLLYAQWTPIDYSISFDSIGGSNSPATETKNIGQTVTLPNPGTRTGYDFSGWTLGGVTYGVGTTYTVGSTNAAFTALWTAKRFNVSYDWNGGVGTPTASSIYTYGNAAITLPTGSSHTKDGYIFNGWKDQDGNTIGTTHTPTQDTRYVAQWIDGSYTITYNTVGGTLAQSSVSVARTAATTLPTPTRTNYTFDGWYEDSATTVVHGQAGASVTPTSSRTLYAKWVQDSLSGINPAHLNSLTTITTQTNNASSWTGSHSLSGTGARLDIPADALPNGTVVQVSFVEDLTRPKNLINDNYAYYTSVVLHWQLGTGSSATVPVAAAGKPLALTLTNPDIREGAKIYKIIRGVATEVATATQDGQVTINVYEDPEIVVAATTPTAPLSVTALGNLNGQSTVSWTAPAISGGAEVTSYTVTSSPGNQTCTATGTTSCTVSGLTNDSTYTFTVVANNAVGSSVASAASSGIIPRLRPTFNATFDSKGGSSVSDTLFNNTDGISQPNTPTKSGYTFAGWLSTDGDASTLVTFPYSPNVNNDVTLYAYWTANAVNTGGGTNTSAPTVSPIINAPATSPVEPSVRTPLINMPAAPAPITAPISQFPELQNAPYPTNGLNVPAVGEIVTLINRVPVQPIITTQQNQTVIEFSDSISMTLAPRTNEGTEIPPTTEGVIRVLQGSVIDAAGSGFKAGSPVEAWVYSTPTRLGSGIADSNGEFEQTFKIDDEFKLGKHTIVLNGLTPKNEIFTVALGIQVVDQIPVEVQPDLEDGSNLLVRVVQILVILAFFFILLHLFRRPRKH